MLRKEKFYFLIIFFNEPENGFLDRMTGLTGFSGKAVCFIRRSNAPARRSNAPARRSNAPAWRSNAPARRANTPARRAEALAWRADAPARRSNAPARRANASARDEKKSDRWRNSRDHDDTRKRDNKFLAKKFQKIFPLPADV